MRLSAPHTLRWRPASLGLLLALSLASGAAAGPRVYSLDQCADQYVIALAPREDIAAVSPRADDADSYLRRQAGGLPRGRASLEAVLASRAGVVLRYWGGDAMLTAALERRGVTVVTIDDASDFAGVRADVRKVAAALGQPARGEALVAGMDGKLAQAVGAGRGQSALYLTSGGFTAGPDTLIGAMLRAAGFGNLTTRPSYTPVGLERMALSPPAALLLGFFDRVSLSTQAWAFGRHRMVQQAARGRTLAALPSSILACPAWFAADGPLLLAQAARPR